MINYIYKEKYNFVPGIKHLVHVEFLNNCITSTGITIPQEDAKFKSIYYNENNKTFWVPTEDKSNYANSIIVEY